MPDFKPAKIIIHHSLTKDSGTVSWGAIRAYHTHTLGWYDIGYHAGIELVKSGGFPYYEVLMGRPWSMPGAHCRGQNHDSLGICFVGNYDERAPNDLILYAGAKMIKMWIKFFDIGIDDIYGHRDFAAHKSCPGTRFDLDRLKEKLNGRP